MKRVSIELHSDELADQLAHVVAEGVLLITSALARVEVGRALRTRMDAAPELDLARSLADAFAGVAVAPITESVIEHARLIGPPILRSLDAIHLASAVAVAADELWTYDERLAQACDELGIVARMPR